MSKEAEPLDRSTPRTEEEIRAHTIGELKPLSGRMLIVDYDPHWSELFAHEADRIRSVLGRRALQIEHCSSSSSRGAPARVRHAAQPLPSVRLAQDRPTPGRRARAGCEGRRAARPSSAG